MGGFRCVPIGTAVAERWRSTGFDDRGNRLRHVEATPGGGFPCRHCLRLARAGDAMLLGSYELIGPSGIYWTPSPIFVHADRCAAYRAEGEVAPIIGGNSLVSVRAYDEADQCLYDLGQVCDGASAAEPLQRAFADARTAFANVHTARPGCLLARVERLG